MSADSRFIIATVDGADVRIPRSWLAGYCKGSVSGGVRRLTAEEGARAWRERAPRPEAGTTRERGYPAEPHNPQGSSDSLHPRR